MKTMHSNAKLLEGFYLAFQRLDGDAMAACYHSEAVFSDPVFPELKGDQPGAMWRMLCAQATNFDLVFGQINGDARSGSAYWEASYDFSATGRRVCNKIRSTFAFEEGRIIRQEDTFDFWAWSRMALGLPGLMLGWTPLLRKKVQGQAAASLARFVAKA